MKFIVGISLALGDLYNKAGLGTLRIPIDGAVARFQAVRREVMAHDDKFIIMCTAGYTKKEPLIPQPERRESLALQLSRYVRENCPEQIMGLLALPICWSTVNEVRMGIKMTSRLKFAKRTDDVTVVIASNLTHLVRIWIYAKLYTPRNWKFKLVRARHQFTLGSHLWEIPKLIRDILRTFKVLRRLNLRKQKT